MKIKNDTTKTEEKSWNEYMRERDERFIREWKAHLAEMLDEARGRIESGEGSDRDREVVRRLELPPEELARENREIAERESEFHRRFRRSVAVLVSRRLIKWRSDLLLMPKSWMLREVIEKAEQLEK